jgi:hypothetical protein
MRRAWDVLPSAAGSPKHAGLRSELNEAVPGGISIEHEVAIGNLYDCVVPQSGIAAGTNYAEDGTATATFARLIGLAAL